MRGNKNQSADGSQAGTFADPCDQRRAAVTDRRVIESWCGPVLVEAKRPSRLRRPAGTGFPATSAAHDTRYWAESHHRAQGLREGKGEVAF